MNKLICQRCNKSQAKYNSKEEAGLKICRCCRNRERYKTDPTIKGTMASIAKRYYLKVKLTDPEKHEKNRIKRRDYANSVDQRFKRLLHCAAIRNLEVSITIEDYSNMINHDTKCDYCLNKALGVNNGYGLDRKDNNKGYTKENLIPCCGKCNREKNKRLTYEEYKAVWNVRNNNKTKG